MKKLKILIVDDEKDAREGTRTLLMEYCMEVEIVGEAGSSSEGAELVRRFRPDLVILDVEMPGGSGFELIRQFDEPDFDVIFLTAYSHYAIKAIKASALDYLLKPVDVDDLVLAVEKARKEILAGNQSQFTTLLQNLADPLPQRLTIKTLEGNIYLWIKDIIRLEADGSYTRIFLSNGDSYLGSHHLKEYEKLMEGHPFFRVHNSHLLHLTKVVKYLREDGGFAEMEDGSRVEISRRKKDAFLAKMNDLT